MSELNTDQFREIENDPTKRKETKLQNLFRSLKNNKHLMTLFVLGNSKTSQIKRKWHRRELTFIQVDG